MNSKNNQWVFPNIVTINYRPGRKTLATYVRKKHTNGKWYLFKVESGVFDYRQEDMYQLSEFLKEVYLAQLQMKIIPEVRNAFSEIFYLDEFQGSEEERLGMIPIPLEVDEVVNQEFYD